MNFTGRHRILQRPKDLGYFLFQEFLFFIGKNWKTVDIMDTMSMLIIAWGLNGYYYHGLALEPVAPN